MIKRSQCRISSLSQTRPIAYRRSGCWPWESARGTDVWSVSVVTFVSYRSNKRLRRHLNENFEIIVMTQAERIHPVGEEKESHKFRQFYSIGNLAMILLGLSGSVEGERFARWIRYYLSRSRASRSGKLTTAADTGFAQNIGNNRIEQWHVCVGK